MSCTVVINCTYQMHTVYVRTEYVGSRTPGQGTGTKWEDALDRSGKQKVKRKKNHPGTKLDSLFW